METTKDFYKSKTFWINLIALVALVIQQFTGFIIDAGAQAAILVIVNLILRAVTGDVVSFGGKVFVKR